ncbi:E3 binding domain-containing protein [Rubrobacter marinus]|nr:E3 binding domain-containing protein [Rubrobacter marinus]
MERSNGAFADPVKLWGQWYENTSRVWTDAMKSAQDGGFADPYGLYRQWISAVSPNGAVAINGSEPAGAVSPGSMPGMGGMPQMDQKSIQENTQRWLAMTAETFRKTAEISTGLLELGPRWLTMLEEVRDNLLNGDALPTDPLSFGVRWYNATSEPLSRFVGEILESDEFLESSSRFFENYAVLYKVFSKNSEEFLRTVQLPTRSDMSRVAGLVVALENKVDGVEEVLEDVVDDFGAGLASEDGLGAVEGRVGSVEDRLGAVEGKLDRLLAAVEALGDAQQQAPAQEAPSASQNGSAPASQEEQPSSQIRATSAARRRAEEMGIDLASVEGTGPNGQITVGDVRKKGDS